MAKMSHEVIQIFVNFICFLIILFFFNFRHKNYKEDFLFI